MVALWRLRFLVVAAIAGLVVAAACTSGGTDEESAASPPGTSTSTPMSEPKASATATPIRGSGVSTRSNGRSTPVPDVPGPTGAAQIATSAPTQTPPSAEVIAPDPDYESALKEGRFSTSGWKTDFSLHSVPYSEILQAASARDGTIAAIDDPKFDTVADADAWIGPREPVIAVNLDGDARAYPLQILTWHEIVNDVVAGVPVTVTFCPLCNSAIVFERTLNGVVYDFGVSGNLRNSDLIMYDRQTHTWWQQLTGEAIVGELTGKRLGFVSAPLISWEDFRDANPEGKVLSRETGYNRAYGRNPYAGYDDIDNTPFLFEGETDDRLLPMERVAALSIGRVDAAFPHSILAKERIVSYRVNGRDLVILFKPGAASALDRGSIRDSRDVGATGVFDPVLEGRKLTFRLDGDTFVDNETGSEWNILGTAVNGPLQGKALTPIVHANHFWFAWGAFRPDTKIYTGAP